MCEKNVTKGLTMDFRKRLDMLLQEMTSAEAEQKAEQIAYKSYMKSKKYTGEMADKVNKGLSTVAGVGGALAGGAAAGPAGALVGGASGYGGMRAMHPVFSKVLPSKENVKLLQDKNPFISYSKAGLAGALAGGAAGAIMGTGAGTIDALDNHQNFDPEYTGAGAAVGALYGGIGALLGNYMGRVAYQSKVKAIKEKLLKGQGK